MDLPATAPKPVTEAEVTKAMAALNGDQVSADKSTATQQPPLPPAPKADAKPAESKPEVPETMDDEDPLPTDERALLKQMTLKSFMRRVSSMTRANLRKNFGTDDVEKLIAERKELETLRAEKAKAEKDKLTETDRLKLEKQEAEERAQKAEERAEQRVERAVAKEVESELKAHVRGLVDKENVEDFLDKLARAAAKKDNNITSVRGLMRYASKYVEEHPVWRKAEAKPADDKKPEEKKPDDKKPKTKDKKPEEKPEPRRIPLHTGGRRVTDTKPEPTANGEAATLGKMTRQQIFEKSGLKW